MMPFGYGLSPGFWFDLFSVISVVILLVIVIPAILRRKTGANKKKWYSNNYINATHKNGDVAIRIIGLILLIAGIIFYTNELFILLGISMFILIVQLVFQAYYEWKYSENRKNYKITLSEIFFALVSFIVVLLWIPPS